MQAVVFCGIQGAGKTSFYRRRFADTHVRLSLDMLRTRNRERILLEACIAAQQPFVVDNTNPTAAERRLYVEAAATGRFEIVGYYFRSSAQEALAINEQRAEAERLPVKGLLGTLKRLELPRLDEGFDRLFYVRMDGDGGFVEEAWVE
jgi:predicted kinase